MKEKKNNHDNCKHLQDAKHASTGWMDNKREMFGGKTFKTSDCKVTGRGRGITKSSVSCLALPGCVLLGGPLVFLTQPSLPPAQASSIGSAQRREAELI